MKGNERNVDVFLGGSLAMDALSKGNLSLTFHAGQLKGSAGSAVGKGFRLRVP